MPSDMRSSQLRLVTCVLDVLRASRSFVRSLAKINLFRIPQVLPSNSREREYSHYQTGARHRSEVKPLGALPSNLQNGH